MIKSIFDSDESEQTEKGSSSASSGSILDLKTPNAPAESFDPFAITDHHMLAASAAKPDAQPVSHAAEPAPAAEPDKAENSNTGSASTKEIEYFAPTTAESVRMSGLAWSAGIMFFGSVGFMLVLGWLVDTLLGSSPWGIVGGIVLGSIIGFVQLIRINTQILNTPSSAPRSLMDQAGSGVNENADSPSPPPQNDPELEPESEPQPIELPRSELETPFDEFPEAVSDEARDEVARPL